ncbi:MAG: GTP-binding protein, partial [Myxococcales bacterium]|nr:GTP-binding protein [Myxococcales bacterium]
MRPQPHEATPLRNIGISAHIDAGKTTLSERILFYAGKIHRIGEVRGDVGATMDSHELERERGITIRSAATQVRWGDHAINLIDTPGHVDFTIEVERALSALDGVVLVLCGVAGVQPQTLTIDRQIRRHELPRLVFINKLDRPGADAEAVLADLRARVDPGAVLVNLPRFDDQGRLVGIVDLIDRRLLTFEGERGAIVRGQPLPDELRGPTEGARERLLEALADHSDAIMASLVDGVEVSAEEIIPVLRKATIERQLTPVLCGSAHLEIGVQPLLDAVVRYLPAPAERPRTVVDVATGEALHLDGGAAGPLCAHAFKVDAGSFGQLTYLRILQGRLTRGQRVTNARSGQRIKVGRLVRIHASSMEEIEVAEAGDIVGLFGVECVHGDTFTEGARWSVGALHVPEPVM